MGAQTGDRVQGCRPLKRIETQGEDGGPEMRWGSVKVTVAQGGEDTRIVRGWGLGKSPFLR